MIKILFLSIFKQSGSEVLSSFQKILNQQHDICKQYKSDNF